MLGIEAFSLRNELVHVQAVPGSSIDSAVVTPRQTLLSEKNLIESLVVKYPYHIPQRLLEIPEGWD